METTQDLIFRDGTASLTVDVLILTDGEFEGLPNEVFFGRLSPGAGFDSNIAEIVQDQANVDIFDIDRKNTVN